MQLKDFMVKTVLTVDPDSDCAAAARQMRDRDVGCLVVAKSDGVVEGVITDRDLAIGCLSEGHDSQVCKVRQHMSGPAITAEPTTDGLDAARLMTDKRIKRLPVMEDGKLVGLVSFSDFADAMIWPVLQLLSGLGAYRHVS